MLKNLLRLLPVVALAVVAALPASASAAGGGGGGGTGITMTIGSASMEGRLLVTVPVTIQCSGPIADAPLGFGSINVSVEQAFGKSVSHGSGGVSLTVCPSSPQTFDVLVTPDLYPVPSSAFHGGTAIADASAFASDPTFTIFVGGSAGPQIVKL